MQKQKRTRKPRHSHGKIIQIALGRSLGSGDQPALHALTNTGFVFVYDEDEDHYGIWRQLSELSVETIEESPSDSAEDSDEDDNSDEDD